MRKSKRLLASVVVAGMIIGGGIQSRVSAQQLNSPTLDLVLFFSNADVPNSVQVPAPDRLIVTERSGEVSVRTWIGSDGQVKSTVQLVRTGPGATLTLTVKLVSITEFEATGKIVFDDAQGSTLEFQSVGRGSFAEEAVLINGIPFTHGGYVARVTQATGRFAGMTGTVTDNFWLDVSGGPLDRAIGYQFMVIRLAQRQ